MYFWWAALFCFEHQSNFFGRSGTETFYLLEIMHFPYSIWYMPIVSQRESHTFEIHLTASNIFQWQQNGFPWLV